MENCHEKRKGNVTSCVLAETLVPVCLSILDYHAAHCRCPRVVCYVVNATVHYKKCVKLCALFAVHCGPPLPQRLWCCGLPGLLGANTGERTAAKSFLQSLWLSKATESSHEEDWSSTGATFPSQSGCLEIPGRLALLLGQTARPVAGGNKVSFYKKQ